MGYSSLPSSAVILRDNDLRLPLTAGTPHKAGQGRLPSVRDTTLRALAPAAPKQGVDRAQGLPAGETGATILLDLVVGHEAGPDLRGGRNCARPGLEVVRDREIAGESRTLVAGAGGGVEAGPGIERGQDREEEIERGLLHCRSRGTEGGLSEGKSPSPGASPGHGHGTELDGGLVPGREDEAFGRDRDRKTAIVTASPHPAPFPSHPSFSCVEPVPGCHSNKY